MLLPTGFQKVYFYHITAYRVCVCHSVARLQNTQSAVVINNCRFPRSSQKFPSYGGYLYSNAVSSLQHKAMNGRIISANDVEESGHGIILGTIMELAWKE
jgi:hypothetical protein